MCSNTKYTNSKRRVKEARLLKNRAAKNRRKVEGLKKAGILFQE